MADIRVDHQNEVHPKITLAASQTVINVAVGQPGLKARKGAGRLGMISDIDWYYRDAIGGEQFYVPAKSMFALRLVDGSNFSFIAEGTGAGTLYLMTIN